MSRFQILYIDCPWTYDDPDPGGRVGPGYPQLDLDALKRLAFPAIMARGSFCFSWVTTPLKYSHGLPTLDAWGYDYVTTIYWHKTGRLAKDGQRIVNQPGTGHWFSGDVEELLFGVDKRHRPAPFRSMISNIIAAPREGHSKKPEVFRDLIVRATGEPSSRRNLEVFATKTTPGWTALGNRIDGLDIREAIRLQALAIHGSRGAAAGALAGAGLTGPVGIG